MVQWDTEDDKCDVYYVIIDDLSWENGGMIWIGYMGAGITRIGFGGDI